MTTTVRNLWGINRPDGSPVTSPTKVGSSFWVPTYHGFPEGYQNCAELGAIELAEALMRLGVSPDAAKHEVVYITITTEVTRTIDWPRTVDETESNEDSV